MRLLAVIAVFLATALLVVAPWVGDVEVLLKAFISLTLGATGVLWAGFIWSRMS